MQVQWESKAQYSTYIWQLLDKSLFSGFPLHVHEVSKFSTARPTDILAE